MERLVSMPETRDDQTPQRTRISVIGLGSVGSVTCACLARIGHDVLAVDVDPIRRAAVAAGRSPVAEPGLDDELARQTAAGRLAVTSDIKHAVAQTDMSIVTVGTPAQDDGSISLDEVRSALEDIGVGIGAKAAPHVVVLRSTVPPGVSQDVAIPLLERRSGRRLGSGLEFQMHPEFLRAGVALQDFDHPPLILIGERSGASAPALRSLYSGSNAPVRTTSYKIAESVKLLSNVFHAVKVTFANEAGAALAGIGLDANEAFDLLCSDSALNISPKYLRPGFAFGGSCLPKDLGAFLHLAEREGVATPFLGSIPRANRTVVDRALALINPRPGSSVAMFGLAFKPGTDDVRGSPFAAVAAALVAKGCKVAIVDPLVRRAWAARPEGAPAERRDLANLLADDAGAALAAAETVILAHASPEDLEALNAGAQDKYVVDLGIHPQLALRRGPAYRGLCW